MTVSEKEAAGISKYAPSKEISKLLQKDAEGNVVAVHYSIRQAAKAMCVSASAVGNAVRRHGKCKGFYLEYEQPPRKVFKAPEPRRVFNHMAHIPYFG